MEKLTGHVGFIATTQSGKTTASTRYLSQTGKKVLIINTKHSKMQGHKITDKEIKSFDHLKRLMERYKMVNLHIDYEARHEVLTHIIKKIFESKYQCIVYVDELLEFDGDITQIKRLATTGLELGYWLWWSSQALANVNGTIERQTESKVFFYGLDNLAKKHIEGKEYPIDEIQSKLKEKYQHVIVKNNKVSLVQKVKV